MSTAALGGPSFSSLSSSIITVYFVQESSDREPDDEMNLAYHRCTEHNSAGIFSTWISKPSLMSKKDELNKNDVVVFDKFEGKEFETISKTRAMVVGARCLSCCLSEGSEIPSEPHPIYTIAMRDLVITGTGLPSAVKEKIRTKIKQMAGKYSTNLFEATTHLIANNVLSVKYKLACNRNIKVMKAEWVDAVWEASLQRNISASDPQFDEYRVPIFYNLIITTSSIPKKEKKVIVDLINKHGGIFNGNFEAEVTNVLIMKTDGIGSDKFNCARSNNTPCVVPDWITDSIEKGHILDFDNYLIKINKTSSPLQDKNLPDFSLNISNIPNPKTVVRGSVNETYMNVPPTPLQKTPKKNQNPDRICPTAKESAQLVDSLDMKSVRQAGSFLDGCCIYVCNFTVTRREKVHRIVSRAGGVRYDTPHEAVTHVICGDSATVISAADKAAMPRAIFINIAWLVDSMKAEKPLEEQPYLIEGDDDFNRKSNSGERVKNLTMSSPMSKKNLQLLKPSAKAIVPPPVWETNDEEEPKEVVDILEQYRSQQNMSPEDETLLDNKVLTQNNKRDEATMTSNNGTLVDKEKLNEDNQNEDDEECSEYPQVFVGITFKLLGMEKSEDITNNIEGCGGKIVEPDETAEYIVVPIEFDENEIENKTSKVVTTMWLDDCLIKDELVPIDYYHRPLKMPPNCTPLNGLVLSVSTYFGSERRFIHETAEFLGAIVQLNFCRKETSTNKASTHLICPEPSGAKYQGAVKWGIPAVTSLWLIDCANKGKRLREGPYLVGDAKEPIWENEDVEDTKVEDEKSISNKENNISNQEVSIPEKDASLKHVSSEMALELVCPSDSDKEVVNKVGNISTHNTPTRRTLGKLSLGGSELSPASRFIRMAKLGYLGTDSQESPKQTKEVTINKNKDETLSTPPMENALSTPNLALFSTTSRRRLAAIKRGEMPSDPPHTPVNPFDIKIKTPDSGFGAILRPDDGVMSPTSRKKLFKYCEGIPEPIDFNSSVETPLSELKKGFLKRMNEEYLDSTPLNTKDSKRTSAVETPPAKKRIIEAESTPTSVMSPVQADNLKQLISMITGDSSLPGTSSTPGSAQRKKTLPVTPIPLDVSERILNMVQPNFESQPDTVGWEDIDESAFNKNKIACKPKVYKFMLSQTIVNPSEVKSIINRLGGEVLDNKAYDSSATHMICSKLTRSEKVLASVASGIWLLHPQYINKCDEEEKFVDEELYEWGNPKAEILRNLSPGSDFEKKLAYSAYKWRMNRESNEGGPFRGMRFLLHVTEEKRKAFGSLIKFGGGEVVEASPPYSGDMNITFCIAETAKMNVSAQDTEYLISRKISLCPAQAIISLLTDDPIQSPLKYAFPHYLKLL